MRADCHVGQGANLSERVRIKVRAWREVFFRLYSSCVQGGGEMTLNTLHASFFRGLISFC